MAAATEIYDQGLLDLFGMIPEAAEIIDKHMAAERLALKDAAIAEEEYEATKRENAKLATESNNRGNECIKLGREIAKLRHVVEVADNLRRLIMHAPDCRYDGERPCNCSVRVQADLYDLARALLGEKDE
jgi:hypothetical protein